MELTGKVAVVHGAAGSMGGAVARAFAAAGATVHLGGRTLKALDEVADDIRSAGGTASTAEVDVDDEAAVERHADAVVEESGRFDVVFNATGMDAVQNVPHVDLALDDFLSPIVVSARRQFLTSRAAARRMVAQGSGTIVFLTASSAREWRHEMGGFNVACAGIEALTRSLAGELGPHGVRVVCLRPNFTPETMPAIDPPARLIDDTTLGRLPRLSEVAGSAVFAASDRAGAISGAVLNLTCGAIVD